MNRIFTITAALLMLFTTVNAQKNNWIEAGVWESKGTSWSYSLGKNTGNTGSKFESGEQAKTSVSSTSTPGFLPYPSSGFAAVSSAANAGGAFKIEGKGDAAKFTIDAAVAGGANKFAVYEVAKAAPVSSLFFTLAFNENNPTNGSVILGFGNSRGNNIFKNANSLTGADASGVFAALRWEFSTNKAVFFSYRTLKDASYSYKLINTSSFTKTGEHKVELYANNTAAEQKYNRGGRSYTIPALSFNIWVNGNMATSEAGSSFPASGELGPDAPLNAFLFQGYHSKAPFPNALSITLGDFQVNTAK